MTNHNKYQITCVWNNDTQGTHNIIAASAATLKGCLSEYKRVVKNRQLMHTQKPLYTFVYCDGNKIDVDLSQYN